VEVTVGEVVGSGTMGSSILSDGEFEGETVEESVGKLEGSLVGADAGSVREGVGLVVSVLGMMKPPSISREGKLEGATEGANVNSAGTRTIDERRKIMTLEEGPFILVRGFKKEKREGVGS